MCSQEDKAKASQRVVKHSKVARCSEEHMEHKVWEHLVESKDKEFPMEDPKELFKEGLMVVVKV